MTTKQKTSTVNTVNITTQMYDKLAVLDRNRPIVIPHVQSMKESVLRHGVLRQVIVVFNKAKGKFLIVDGQHLSVALQDLGYDIECRVVDCETEEEITQLMIDLNNTSKSWKLEDFIHGWAASGLKSYKHLKTAIAMSDIQMSVIIQAYTQKTRGVATKLVKTGNFEIVNKLRGDELIDYISDCMTIVPSTRAMGEALIKLMLSIEQYNHKRMLKNCKAAKSIAFSHKEGELFQQLVEIYNR